MPDNKSITKSRTVPDDLSDGVGYSNIFIPDIFFHDENKDNKFLKMLEKAFGDNGEKFWDNLFKKCKGNHNCAKSFIFVFTEHQLYYLKNWLDKKYKNKKIKINLEQNRKSCFKRPENTRETVDVCLVKFKDKRGNLETKKIIFTSDDNIKFQDKEPTDTIYFFENSFASIDLSQFPYESDDDCKRTLINGVFSGKVRDSIKMRFNRAIFPVTIDENKVPRCGASYIFYLGDTYGLDKDEDKKKRKR